MITLSASKIAEIVDGQLHGDDVSITAPAFLSSRECVAGSIFLAIEGENVDGHKYVSDAFAHGAVLALTSRQVDERCVVVENVTEAIGKLAKYVRSSLENLTVIGITGSQGKTTTKELLSSILATAGETISPSGNYNNELGVPITLLQCDEGTKFCIVEMGARHLGDIRKLAAIAKPEIGVVLRVAAAHLGEFGSIEKIAETKSEMISSLNPDGVAVLGQYDEFTPKMRNLHSGSVITFGEKVDSMIRATDIELRDGRAQFELVTPEGRSTVVLREYGLHQIPNALAAAAVASILGLSTEKIAGALSIAETRARWRMEVSELEDLTIINDSYNASPDSMVAALSTLAHLSQERGGESWAFIGIMRELGESSATAHAEIGRLASHIGIDHIVAINSPEYGEAIPSGSMTAMHLCKDKREALEIARHINRGDVVLCKASRSERLEELAEGIEASWLQRIEDEEASR